MSLNTLISKIDRQESFEVEMNSEKAAEYLEKYANFDGQRPIRTPRINMHKTTITDGMFLASTIYIGCYHEDDDHRTRKKESLIDGHHRLFAICEANTNDTIKIIVVKVHASIEVIRQLYGYFDNKKSSRSLEDILRWKVAFHPELKNRWDYSNLATMALSLPYASGHFFAVLPNGNRMSKKSFTFNACPKGITMGKDDFLQDSLDVRSWWFALDKLDEFLNGLKDRNNYSDIKKNLGYVVYGVFLKSIMCLSNRGRNGNALNKTLSFWDALINSQQDADNDFRNTSELFKNMWKIIRKAKREENLGNVGKGFQTLPIFYAVSQAHKRWMNNSTVFGLGWDTAKNVKGKDVLSEFFNDGEIIYPIHNTYKENRYWDKHQG